MSAADRAKDIVPGEDADWQTVRLRGTKNRAGRNRTQNAAGILPVAFVRLYE